MIDLEQIIEQIVERKLNERLAKIAAEATPEHVTVAEYARTHSISPRTVCTAIKAGRLPAITVGRNYRIPRGAEIGRPAEVRPRSESLQERAQKLLRGGGRR